jgi:hypothetical protein
MYVNNFINNNKNHVLVVVNRTLSSSPTVANNTLP